MMARYSFIIQPRFKSGVTRHKVIESDLNFDLVLQKLLAQNPGKVIVSHKHYLVDMEPELKALINLLVTRSKNCLLLRLVKNRVYMLRDHHRFIEAEEAYPVLLGTYKKWVAPTYLTDSKKVLGAKLLYLTKKIK